MLKHLYVIIVSSVRKNKPNAVILKLLETVIQHTGTFLTPVISCIHWFITS